MLLVLAGTFGLLWLHLAARRGAMGFARLSRRGALVLAFVAFELLALVISELSSVGHHFTRGVVAVLWGMVLVALAAAAVGPLRRRAAAIRATGGWPSRLRTRIGVLSIEDRGWLVVLAVIFGILTYLGLRYLPSNSDSLVYHLARVEHWIENRTVAPFATHYLPQVEFAPLAEYTQAQLHLLGGTDRFDAVVALLAAAVTVIGVSELARMLGANRSVQIAAAVVCATIPPFVLLATSTENDVFAAAVGMALLIVLLGQSGGAGWPWRAATLGVTTGLAYMTKATIPLMLLPAGLLLLALALYRHRDAIRGAEALRRSVAWGAVVVVGVLAVAGPFLIQETQVFHSPVGPASTASASSPLTPDAGAANVVRNLADNFHVGNGRSGWDYELSRAVLPSLAHVYNLFHIAQDDPRYSVTTAYRAFTVQDYSTSDRNEVNGADPLGIILIVVSFGVLVVAVGRGARELRTALVLAVGLAAGYLLFTATARWGIWDGRYDLTLLSAWAALIAIALSRTTVWVTRVVLVVLVVTCLPQLLDSATRPLVPSAAFEATYHSSYLEPYLINCCTFDPASEATAYADVTQALAQSTCRHAAIDDFIEFEYPLWVGLRHNHWTGMLDDVDVHNPTSTLESTGPRCAWISSRGTSFVTPDNGTANVQIDDLVLSIDADRASTIRTAIPRFTGSVDGARVFAGGGWSLTGLGQDPVLLGHGSLYVTSDAPRRVRLVLHLPPHVPQPAVTITGKDGVVIPSTVGPRTIQATLDVHRGANRINLSLSPSRQTGRRALVLESVSVAPSRR
jgi:hypothetical protein